MCWLSPPARASFHFTPFVRAETGYDDNVRLRREARSDFYVTANPGFSLDWAGPTSKLTLKGDIRYSEYYRLSEYTQVNGGNGSLNWDYTPSPYWTLQVFDKYASTYDPPEVDEEGRLILVRSDSGRRDRNTAGMSLRHNFGPQSFIGASARNTQNTYSSGTVDDSQKHEFSLSAGHRLSPDWQATADGNYNYDDYERSEDITRTRASASLIRMLGPTASAMLTIGYTQVRAETDNPQVRQARNYDVYRVGASFNHKVSPTFEWNAAVGWDQVDGDRQANDAAGSGHPTFSANATWTGQRWRLGLNAFKSLGEQEIIGENYGLTISHGGGVTFSYELDKHWSLTANAAYVHNKYAQDPSLADLESGQDTDSFVGGVKLSWKVTRRASLSLDYRYLVRDSQDDRDDRSQNLVFFTFTYEVPYRW